MSQTDDVAGVENLSRLLQGDLPWEDVKKLLRLKPKDSDRFWKYLEALQKMIPWEDRILLRISELLYVVLKTNSVRIVKCACGHEYGDYRENWKINAMIYVRRTQEEIDQVYRPAGVVGPRPGWGEMREYYCPGCGGQLAVEVVPPGYPPIFEILPDIDTFYRELGRPLEASDPDGYLDLTSRRTEAWTKEN
ncbi:MAG: acetone carboxylase subunit gamma [Candidatus Binatia bacterium]|nr:acetone carboxylase subunit gamma [Candidatus Binatia bacterium]